MRGKNYITINGSRYDAVTGLPVNETIETPKPVSKPVVSRGRVMSDVGFVPAHKRNASAQSTDTKVVAARQPAKNAQTNHAVQQPSKTLRRSGLQKPAAVVKKMAPATSTRSAHISKFNAPNFHKSAITASSAKAAQPVTSKVKAAAPKTSHSPAKILGTKNQQLKNALIKQSLRDVDTIAHLDKKKGVKAKLRIKHPRFGSILAGVAAMVILGGYLTYMNMPGLSMKIAATRANIAATYPSYNPSGYSFNGPVAFSNGEVKVKFKSNTNDFAYTVSEKNSPWDSQALLDNYVAPKNKDYITLQESGLTIYLHDNKASWVNGGVLYSVDYESAPLSSDQIQKIASSTL